LFCVIAMAGDVGVVAEADNGNRVAAAAMAAIANTLILFTIVLPLLCDGQAY
jgi:fumarate reductase subunit D